MTTIVSGPRALLAVSAVLAVAGSAPAQLAYRVADLPTVLSTGSRAHGFTEHAGAVYFSAYDSGDGDELWRTDGTEAGTRLVRDLVPGTFGSSPEELTSFAGRLYFATTNELMSSDGTAAGTRPVSPRVVFPRHLTVAGSLLFFSALDGLGEELWRTDGTPAGTRRVKDIAPGFDSSSPGPIVAIGGAVYFAATGPLGRELWRSDGTEAGTAPVVDLVPGVDSSDPRGLARVGGRLFFEAAAPGLGRELWSSDGTPAGTLLAADSSAGGADSHVASITDFDGVALYTNDVPGSGRELWRSDGTPGGTRLVADVRPGDSSAAPEQLVVQDHVLYFVADDGVNGFELWRSDGTAAGTSIVRVLHDPFNSPDRPRFLTRLGDGLVFVADDGTGAQLWRSDGTEAGTFKVGDDARWPEDLTAAGDRLFFTALLLEGGREPHVSDTTAAGTRLLRDIEKPDSWFGGSGIDLNGSLVFDVIQHGVWRTDGTAVTTIPITTNPSASVLGVLGGRAYVTHLSPIFEGGVIFLSRTNAAGTDLEFVTGMPGPASGPRVVAGGQLFFALSDVAHGLELWRTDGTAAGTRLVRDIRPGTESSNLSALTAAGAQVFFVADDGVSGRELWRSDGTEAGTVRVKDIRVGPASSISTLTLTALGSSVLFGAHDGTHGAELWRSDGTEAGTVMVKDIHPFAESTPRGMVAVGAQVYFTADDPAAGLELWRSDGTELGTVQVADLAPGLDTWLPWGLGAFGSRLVFSADDGVHGRELWITDGTAGGTTLLKDVAPGSESGLALESGFAEQEGLFFFAGYAPESGLERWRSDGTAAGTVTLGDIHPGPGSSGDLSAPIAVAAGNHLYFPATDGATGRQVWAVRFRPDVSLSPGVIDEGSTGGPVPFTLTATAEPALFADLVAGYATRSGTATSGTDYLPASGTLTFSSAVTSATIDLPVVGDRLDEEDETLFVDLTAPIGPPPERQLTLLDDDPRPRLSVTRATVVEGDAGDSQAVFDVALSEPSGLLVEVQYTTHDVTAFAPADFADTSGVLDLPPGTVTGTVTVPVHGDTVDEPDERFELFLHSPVRAELATPAVEGLIRDDDGEDIALGELAHGQDRREDLAGSTAGDYFMLTRLPDTSFEVVVSGASGDFGDGPSLERVLPATLTVAQGSTPSGAGHARSLRMTNHGVSPLIDYVRVRSLGCTTDCGTDDVYTIQARETTLSVPRINNSGGNVTRLILQNLASTPVQGYATAWSPNGGWAGEVFFLIEGRGVAVLSTTTGVPLPTGSMTIQHDGAYGQLVGKAVTVDPETGFSFDTAIVPRVQ